MEGYNEELDERLELALGRLGEIKKEELSDSAYTQYFRANADLLLMLSDILVNENISAKEMKALNARLYADICGDAYGKSYCDPAYAVRLFGEERGRLLSVVAAEMRSAIPAAAEHDRQPFLIRAEYLLQLYGEVKNSLEDEGELPAYENLKESFYYFVSDYYETESLKKVRGLTDPEDNFALKIIKAAKPFDPDILYMYGEYITDNELVLYKYISGLSDEKIALMADTYTEGYRKGFISTGKDLSKKKTVDIRYPIGLERVVARAVDNFEKMGLKPVIYRAEQSIFTTRSVEKSGYFGANPNRQYDYDHREDLGIILDSQLLTRRLECREEAFKAYREKALVHAGPAVIEVFGEEPFKPVNKKEAITYDAAQRELMARYVSENARINNSYIPGDERSFTIISFPVPEIGEKFEEIFDAVIRINTLDYEKYQTIQGRIIEALNEARFVHVKGGGENRTELKVALYELTDPAQQAIYENCVADVNIPVGEVFTTPVLEGTNGCLNVSKVYLNGLEYKNLFLQFKDGMVSDYGCDNFDDPAEGRRYIEDNVLFHHKSLPMGEAAIGTNTTAYVLARRYDIESRLPILIAEKTGPHFAVGDTCYSHQEDIKVYNPDGREIVARDNSVSVKRKTDPKSAYFGCHTDVTIPYDELELLEGIRVDGSSIKIIENGRFVLEGTEELNKAFEEV
ncbi:MAG: aminopeptidase [Lachnospiraceae bacterium]|nr:aminopeptidase [Lachnospiraceae bacterium]